MNKFNKCLNKINLILWTGLFISIFFIDYDILQLKRLAIGATFIVLVDIFFDMLGNRDKRIRRKVTLEYMVSELDKEKQGEE